MAVGKQHWSIVKWLPSDQAKALLGENFSIVTIPIEGNNRPIQAITPNVATAYWGCQAALGNKQAVALLLACAQETLERRLDAVFALVKSELRYWHRGKHL